MENINSQPGTQQVPPALGQANSTANPLASPTDPLDELFEIKVVRDLLLKKDGEFLAFGKQHAYNGMPCLLDSKEPLFAAGAEEVLSFLRIEAAAHAKTAQALHESDADRLGEQKAEFTKLMEQREQWVEQPMEKPWLSFLLGFIAMVGELPFAFITFKGLVHLQDQMNPILLLNILTISGALGLVATLAALKVVVGFGFEVFQRFTIDGWRVMRSTDARHLRDGGMLPKLIVMVLTSIVFYLFITNMADYRANSLDLKAKEDQLGTLIGSINGATDSTTFVLIKNVNIVISAKQMILVDSERRFFYYYGLLFPLSGALFIVDGEMRRRRKQRLSRLESELSPVKEAIKNQEEATKQRLIALKNAASVSEAIVERNGLLTSFAQRFWWEYTRGFQEAIYDPSRIAHGPSLFEKTEQFRFRFNN